MTVATISKRHPSPDSVLSPGECARLRILILERGEVQTAQDAGVSRQTLSRALAGLDLHRGSVALMRQRLTLATP
jgi:hypothetical protein